MGFLNGGLKRKKVINGIISCHFATFYMFLEQEVALFTYLTYFHICFPSLCIFLCLLQIPGFCRLSFHADWRFSFISQLLFKTTKSPRSPLNPFLLELFDKILFILSSQQAGSCVLFSSSSFLPMLFYLNAMFSSLDFPKIRLSVKVVMY